MNSNQELIAIFLFGVICILFAIRMRIIERKLIWMMYQHFDVGYDDDYPEIICLPKSNVVSELSFVCKRSKDIKRVTCPKCKSIMRQP